MKRLLIVADDRALTRFVAESVLGRKLDNGPPKSSDAWEVARAHTGLEAKLLVTRSGRNFDVIAIDQDVDQTIPDLLRMLRDTFEAREVPIFLLADRGRDINMRRIATEQFAVAGFVDKPVTPERLKKMLGTFERRMRVLLVESNPEKAMLYEDAFRTNGFVVEVTQSGREAVDRAPRFEPDIIVMAAQLSDLNGAEVCVAFKRSRAQGGVPVILFGDSAELLEIDENAHRADDFLQSPFTAEILVKRIRTFAGIGTSSFAVLPPHMFTDDPAVSEPPEEERSQTLPGVGDKSAHQEGHTERAPTPIKKLQPTIRIDKAETKTLSRVPAAPPRSASPSPASSARGRKARRVPCHIDVSVRDGVHNFTSTTLDISHGGILISTDQKVPVGSLLDMSFTFPTKEKPIEAVGRVVWANEPSGPDGEVGVGVKFSKIAREDLETIVQYVNRVSKVVYSAQ